MPGKTAVFYSILSLSTPAQTETSAQKVSKFRGPPPREAQTKDWPWK